MANLRKYNAQFSMCFQYFRCFNNGSNREKSQLAYQMKLLPSRFSAQHLRSNISYYYFKVENLALKELEKWKSIIHEYPFEFGPLEFDKMKGMESELFEQNLTMLWRMSNKLGVNFTVWRFRFGEKANKISSQLLPWPIEFRI